MSNSTTSGENERRPERAAVKRALRSFELSAWLALATLVYVITLILVRRHPGWSPSEKIAVSLVPILPGLFYLKKGIQLLRELDELQRRIQFEAWLFAAIGTVIVGTVINVFNANGLEGKWVAHGLEVGGTYLTMFLLWSVGVVIANLRYR